MSEQTKNEVYETVAVSDIAITPQAEVRWLNGEGTEFEAPPGTKFWISAYTQSLKEDEWHERKKLVSLEVARRLIKAQSQFLIVKELMGNPERLGVLFRSMWVDGGAVKIGQHYYDFGEQDATKDCANV